MSRSYWKERCEPPFEIPKLSEVEFSCISIGKSHFGKLLNIVAEWRGKEIWRFSALNWEDHELSDISEIFISDMASALIEESRRAIEAQIRGES